MKRKITPLLFNIFLVAFLLEISLRFVPFLKTSSEKNEGRYVSYYGAVKNSWYHTWVPNSDNIISGGKEFSYPFKANSLGLREKEFTLEKPDSVFRIIVLGDSYAEGVGTAYDSAWPRFLERLIQSKYGKNFEVINAGVSGSDPFYSYTLLRDKLIHYYPDAVLVSINTSDIYDFIYRGGKDRFQPDGTTHYRKGPWFEPLYHYSYFARASLYLLGYGRGLVKSSSINHWNRVATDSIALVLSDIKKICDTKGISFATVIHSNGGFLKTDFFSSIRKFLGNSIPDIQILDKKVSYANNFDITPEMLDVINEKNSDEYIWHSNYHFTGKGYELFSNILFEKIIQTDSLFFLKRNSD